jgi:hypothetical protein
MIYILYIEKRLEPTVEYTVGYIHLDRHLFTNNAINLSATFANNVRTALE